ncbi:cytochrome c oxidase assembly factor Coa1 family protein [Formosa sp. PL04]|uniref:cytochrome c oxidase assembly factor Coa1 family protein n=1 Tax=Formosa sp. PL04 TaxID=3081755 RepID=UPI002980FAF2|nr:cytochrome c oxidase assembly factor Coa1 family protein [Formosa sp. PL04]MDW5290348.1 cytochrome c oxidase assembly factor Coa1 family protein [Formosa sp. PL04]
MNNELITQKSWWKRNWKWLVPLNAILLISITILITSGISGMGADIAQAYSDTELYQKALEKVKSNQKVIQLLGDIEPIDKLAILEGEVHYTHKNQTVNSSIRLKGTKGNARMDISADKINTEWIYTIINVRIKNPPEKKQTIHIITAE